MTAIKPLNTVNQSEVSEWSDVFLRQATENYTSSVTLMKQLTTVAISIATYLKNVFPADCYRHDKLAGINLTILKKDCEDELAQFVSTALIQAFDAFDKKYLHQLALCFYDGECKVENLIEYHIFEYSYHGDGATMRLHSKGRDSGERTVQFDTVRERTVGLIRSCLANAEASPASLPDDFDISFRLYYNENAPAEYQAPGYAAGGGRDPLGGPRAPAAALGAVATRHHTFTAHCYTRDVVRASHEPVASQNIPVLTQSSQPELFCDPPEETSSPSVSYVQFRCPCAAPGGRALARAALLECWYCKSWQHAACFGLAAGRGPRARHCCLACSDQDASRPPTDPALAALTPSERKSLCLFRSTLEWCSRVAALGARDLADRFRLPEGAAVKLMTLLHRHGVVAHRPEHAAEPPQKIQIVQLNFAIEKYFQRDEQDMIVERLLAETLSQETRSDPVSDVLSPLEKINLQNTCYWSPSADARPLKEISQSDSSRLNQYKDALLSNKMEDLASVREALGEPVIRTHKRKADEPRKEKKISWRSSGVKVKRAKVVPK